MDKKDTHTLSLLPKPEEINMLIFTLSYSQPAWF